MASVILVLVLLSVAATVLALGTRSQWGRRLEAGERVPRFELLLDDGRIVSSRSLLGRRYLIAFFGPNCDFCKSELPWIARSTPPGGIPVVFAVSSGSAAATARFWKEMSVSLPTAVDPDRLVAKAFHVRRVPTLVAVTREGAIDQVRVGVASRPELVAMLRIIGLRPLQSQLSAEGPIRAEDGDCLLSRSSLPDRPCVLVGGVTRAETPIPIERR